MKILYTGLDPKRYRFTGELVHYPVIETVPINELDEATQQVWPKITHVLFTSPTAVKHWLVLAPSLEEKEVLAIGAGTASFFSKALIAPFATQEGMIALLETLDLRDAFLLWPHSVQARPLLSEYLRKNSMAFHSVALYQTVVRNPGPLPDFDEIVFTSPSTVAAFLHLHGHIPWEKKVTAIGPITQKALENVAKGHCSARGVFADER
ncbi:MAG: uroporphyrinogen-III synthase [Verrucomicrobiota bacterium]|nr:uroporphyrinogen-III synthase [Verrucomicrobiota bacterium]